MLDKKGDQPTPQQPPAPSPNTSNQKPAVTPVKQQSPIQNPPTNISPQQPNKKTKTSYQYIGKESLTQLAKKHIPKQFIPTDRFAKILEFIFLAIIILAILQFPLGKLLGGVTDVTIDIGYPFVFLQLNIQSAETPLSILNLLLDVIIYFFLAYLIDILINIISSAHIIKSQEELKKIPKVFTTKK